MPIKKGKFDLLKHKLHEAMDLVRSRWLRITLVAIGFFLLTAGLVYYNLLMITFQDSLAAQSKVESILQRRHDLSTNLAITVLDYARHEKNIMSEVSRLRKEMTNKPGELENEDVKQNPSFTNTMKSILAIAEQYPELKLNENFLNLMNTIALTEQDLAQERMTFTDKLNKYSTILSTFPGNFYNVLFRFEEIPYFQATQEAKTFKPLKY